MRSPIQHPLPLHVPRYVLTFADVEYDAGAFRRVADAEAKAVVMGALADAATRPRLLRLWAQATGESVTAPDRDRGFAQRWLLDALLSRPARLVLLSRLPIAVGGDLEIIEPAPAKALLPPTSLSWLEFEVLYTDAPDAPEPAVGIPYSARTDPDKPKDSRLDRNGYAYISGLEPGSYQVVFPETAVEPEGAAQLARHRACRCGRIAGGRCTVRGQGRGRIAAFEYSRCQRTRSSCEPTTGGTSGDLSESRRAGSRWACLVSERRAHLVLSLLLVNCAVPMQSRTPEMESIPELSAPTPRANTGVEAAAPPPAQAPAAEPAGTEPAQTARTEPPQRRQLAPREPGVRIARGQRAALSQDVEVTFVGNQHKLAEPGDTSEPPLGVGLVLHRDGGATTVYEWLYLKQSRVFAVGDLQLELVDHDYDKFVILRLLGQPPRAAQMPNSKGPKSDPSTKP